MKSTWFLGVVEARSLLAALLIVTPAMGQPAALDTSRAAALFPFNPAIETAFQEGVDAWEDGRYDDAYQRFRAIIEAPENRRTTAAMLMGGRSLLAAGRFAESSGLLTAFIRRYPESRYYDSAVGLRDAAQERYNLGIEAARDVFLIGVLLPMTSRALRFTRSAFEGIRMAADEFNARGGRTVRLIFEDSGGEPRKARAAVRRLIDRAGPTVIIGPLFSEEAIAAAEVAEDAGVPLLVPLATDEAVARGRTNVFQANPTYEMRGRLMARRVVRNLRYTKIGVIADSASYAARMARGFIDEADDLGAATPLVGFLGGLSDWYALADRFGADALAHVDGLYIPVTGDDARGIINVALTSLERTSPRIPLFGNGEWADYPDVARLAQHETVYDVDFMVDSTRAEVVQFDQEYRRRTGEAPDKPAFVGFDVTRFLLQLATDLDERASLPDAFRTRAPYEGLGIRLYFGDGQVNQSVFFHSYGDNGVTRGEE